jgi:hypothetical protein
MNLLHSKRNLKHNKYIYKCKHTDNYRCLELQDTLLFWPFLFTKNEEIKLVMNSLKMYYRTFFNFLKVLKPSLHNKLHTLIDCTFLNSSSKTYRSEKY